MELLEKGLVPVAVGLILASGLILGQAAASGWVAVALTLGSTLFVWRTDRSPLWVLAAGAAAGALLLPGS
jgi:chromate transporter